MEADFRTFFLLVKTLTEIKRNPIFKNITAKNLFLLGETDFVASSNHFFLHFSETLDSDGFFSIYWKSIFFTEILHSGWWKRIFKLEEFFQSFSS